MYLIRIRLYKQKLINADSIQEDLISICDSAATCSAIVHSFLTYIKDYTDEDIADNHTWASDLPLILQNEFSASCLTPSFSININKVFELTVENDIPAIIRKAMFNEV